MPHDDPFEQLDLFATDATPMRARIVARVPTPAEPGSWRLAGAVRGPYCEISSTLPATIKLQPLPSAGRLAAQAVVPDPCAWTGKLPALYQVKLELQQDGRTVAALERWWGVRTLIPHRRSLFLDGKRWAPRGVTATADDRFDPAAWRTAAAVGFVERPAAELCAAASRVGTPLIVRVAGSLRAVRAELRRLAMYPAVMLAAIASDAALVDADLHDEELGAAAPDLPLAQWSPLNASPVALAAWARVMVAEVDTPAAFAARWQAATRPIIAYRPRGDSSSPVEEARLRCDDLQRDLAPYGDFAGYIV